MKELSNMHSAMGLLTRCKKCGRRPGLKKLAKLAKKAGSWTLGWVIVPLIISFGVSSLLFSAVLAGTMPFGFPGPDGLWEWLSILVAVFWYRMMRGVDR